MKPLFKTALALYLFILLWLVLFKFSVDIPGVLDNQMRSLNLIPFAGSQDHLREVIDNFVVFVPFGLLLSVNFKRIDVWRKLACVFVFSIAAETIQFALAIGVADITDVITNTLGGFFGLVLYALGDRYIDTTKQDRFIALVCMVLLVVLLLLRFFVFRVRY